MKFGQDHYTDPRIEITPMIDIVFLLLIFFMISTTFISIPGLKVNLPKTTSREISQQKAEINLMITKEGKIYLDDRSLDEDALSREFLAAFERDAETTVILRADRDASHGKVVQVMDLARRAKLHRLAIATEILENQK